MITLLLQPHVGQHLYLMLYAPRSSGCHPSSQRSGERTVDGKLRVFSEADPERPLERLRVTAELVQASGPTLRIEGGGEQASYEVLLVTELGHGVGLLTSGPRKEPLEIELRELFFLSSEPGSGIALWQVLAQAADTGATRGYLEIRALGPTAEGAIVAASPWIELSWPRGVRDVLLPREVFGE